LPTCLPAIGRSKTAPDGSAWRLERVLSQPAPRTGARRRDRHQRPTPRPQTSSRGHNLGAKRRAP
jgi:hypothetical protein